MMSAKFSVIIPAYNRANVLPRAINSVLAQTYKDFEIIVIDDYSRDSTEDVVKLFDDPRIRYLKHVQNRGGNAARNTGIKEAKGEFVAFLDSDDEWLPEKLEKQLRLFDNPAVGLVYCGFTVIETGASKGQERLVNCDKEFQQDLLVSNFVSTISVAVVRKELLTKIQGFDEELRSCQDWDLYIRLSEISSFACVQEYLALYHIDRKAKNQITTNPAVAVSGHARIEEKYSKKISLLPKIKRLKQIDNLLNIYSSAVSPRGIFLAYRGFKMSGNPKYLTVAFKIIVKRLLKWPYFPGQIFVDHKWRSAGQTSSGNGSELK